MNNTIQPHGLSIKKNKTITLFWSDDVIAKRKERENRLSVGSYLTKNRFETTD